MDTLDTGTYARGRPPGGAPAADTASAVTALYEQHAVSMIRIALIMLGDRTGAEDVVQDAFFGLYRRWARLKDPDKALAYVRSAVLNGCRDALRQRTRRGRRDRAAAAAWQDCPSAEVIALISEGRQRLLAGIRLLPDRQREALVSRFYLGLSEDETGSTELGLLSLQKNAADSSFAFRHLPQRQVHRSPCPGRARLPAGLPAFAFPHRLVATQ